MQAGKKRGIYKVFHSVSWICNYYGVPYYIVNEIVKVEKVKKKSKEL